MVGETDVSQGQGEEYLGQAVKGVCVGDDSHHSFASQIVCRLGDVNSGFC